MRGRYILVLGLVTAVAAGAGWQFRVPVSRALPGPERDGARAGAGGAVVAPTASDEGDLLSVAGVSTIEAGRGPVAPSAPPKRFRGSVRKQLRGSGTSQVPVRRPAPPSPHLASPMSLSAQGSSAPSLSAPSQEPSPEGRARPAPTPSGTGAGTLPPAESGGADGQAGAQAADGASPDASTTGGQGGSPSLPVGGLISLPSSVHDIPPRLVPPRVIDTAGMEYPGEAFRLALRRQDLGPELAVEGAEGTVALRALVSVDGAVRSVEVAASSGSPVLDRAAADAVRRWRFTPATRDGVPIDAYALLRIRYVVR